MIEEEKVQNLFEEYFIKTRPGVIGFIKINRTKNGYKSKEINQFYQSFKAGYIEGVCQG